jgi:hypothetical protein
MAAVTPSQSQVGRLSFSARYAADAAGDTVNNAAILACCEQGPLYQFFATAYATAADMMDAWAEAGGLISVQTSGATTPIASLTRDGSDKPTLVLSAGTAAAPVSIRVALSYSASR